MSDDTSDTQDNDRIAERAYAIWMQAGCPDGQDAEHWRQAKTEISAAQETAATNPIANGSATEKTKSTKIKQRVKKPAGSGGASAARGATSET